MNKNMKHIIFAALVGLTTLATSSVLANATQASARPSQIIRYTIEGQRNYFTDSHGYIYKNATLTKRGAHLTAAKYRNQKMLVTNYVKFKRSNHKIQWFAKVTSKNPALRGFVYKPYLTKAVQKSYKTNGSKSNITKIKSPKKITEASQTANFTLSDYRASFLKYLNEERTKRGTTPVTEDNILDNIAQK